MEDLDTTSANSFASSSSSSSYSNSFDQSTSDYFPTDSAHRSPSSTSDHQLSSSSSSSPPSCPLSLPRDPSFFREIRLPSPEPSNQHQQPMSFRLSPLTSWTVWFTVTEASTYVTFQFYAPLHARLVMLAAKGEPPSLAVHQIYQVISSDETLGKQGHSSSAGRHNHQLQRRSPAAAASGGGSHHREAQLLQLQSTHYFEPGTWYLALLNDLDYTIPLVVNLTTTSTYLNNNNLDGNSQQLCPNGCHNQGLCSSSGQCQCYPGFLGHDCAESKCDGGL